MPTKKSLDTHEKRIQNSSVDKAYAQFLERLQLFGLGLKGCSSSIERVALFAAIEAKKELSRNFQESYKLLRCGSKYFDCEGRLAVTITEKRVPSGPVLLSVECVYDAHLHSTGFQVTFAERFIQTDLALILRPYARALIADITARMSVPPVVLPLANR
jgi:preprotein translocase subunit SecB